MYMCVCKVIFIVYGVKFTCVGGGMVVGVGVF